MYNCIEHLPTENQFGFIMIELKLTLWFWSLWPHKRPASSTTTRSHIDLSHGTNSYNHRHCFVSFSFVCVPLCLAVSNVIKKMIYGFWSSLGWRHFGWRLLTVMTKLFRSGLYCFMVLKLGALVDVCVIYVLFVNGRNRSVNFKFIMMKTKFIRDKQVPPM